VPPTGASSARIRFQGLRSSVAPSLQNVRCAPSRSGRGSVPSVRRVACTGVFSHQGNAPDSGHLRHTLNATVRTRYDTASLRGCNVSVPAVSSSFLAGHQSPSEGWVASPSARETACALSFAVLFAGSFLAQLSGQFQVRGGRISGPGGAGTHILVYDWCPARNELLEQWLWWLSAALFAGRGSAVASRVTGSPASTLGSCSSLVPGAASPSSALARFLGLLAPLRRLAVHRARSVRSAHRYDFGALGVGRQWNAGGSLYQVLH
jgi:hypothetical protein